VTSPLPADAARRHRDRSRGPLAAVALAATVLAAGCAGITTASLVPGTGPGVHTVWPWVFVTVFPVWVVGIAMARPTFPRRLGRSSWWPERSGAGSVLDLLAWLPRAARWIVGAAVAVGIAGTALSFGTLDGQPETVQGRYVANNHGELTELSATQYDAALRAEARGFATSACLFQTLGAALIVASARRRASLGAGTVP